MASDPVRLLCNPEVVRYAEELYRKHQDGFLFNLAEHVHDAARQANLAEAQAPVVGMDADALRQNVLKNCAAASKVAAGAAVASAPAAPAAPVTPEAMAAAAAAAIGSRDGTERVLQPSQMADAIIRAEQYQGDPECGGSKLCRSKGIEWRMHVDDQRVQVTRSRVGGVTKHWVYQCASDAEFQRLRDAVRARRDQLLQQANSPGYSGQKPCPNDACAVLCNSEMHDYADQLLRASNTPLLRDLARRVHEHAVSKVGAVNAAAPSADDDAVALHNNIYENCLAAASTQLAKRELQAEARTVPAVVQVDDPVLMARQLIRAERFCNEPNCAESQSCRERGITWKTSVDERAVAVERSRVGGSNTRWEYKCASADRFDKLLAVTEQERDKLIAKGQFDN